MKKRFNPRVARLTQQASDLKNIDPKSALSLLAKAEGLSAGRNVYISGLRSQCYLNLEMYQEAEKAARRAVELDGGAISLALLTRVFLARGDFEEAERYARQALDARRNSRGLGLLARVQLARGDVASAENNIREAVRLDVSGNCTLMLGQILFSKGQLDEAQQAVEKAISFNPRAISYGLLAEIHRKKREYVKALSAVTKIRPAEQNYQSYLCEAYCLMHLKRFSRAFAQFKKAEASLSKSRKRTFDSRIRLYAGYLFLYQSMVNRGQMVDADLLITAREAGKWLQQKSGHKSVGIFQQDDLKSALKIAAEAGLI